MRLLVIVFFLFFCSGATALVYEVVWSKYLALMLGSTIQAQAMVLAVFMGGLALGNRIFGGWADALRQPVAIYGWIEIAIGLYAVGFNALFALSDRFFVSFGAPLLEQSFALLLLKGTLSVLLLIVPTVLMGGTLPLMAAWLQKHFAEAGRRSALFYAINSVGAVAGAGLAGFVLVKSFGLVATLYGTAAVNVSIGVIALFLARQKAPDKPAEEIPGPVPKKGTAPVTEELPVPPERFRWICLLVFFTGACSMSLEILAARSLSLVFGASLQAFATMLMAFILGIGIGSAIVASPRMTRFLSPKLTHWLLLGAAIWIGLFLLTIEPWAVSYVRLRNSLGGEESGYLVHLLLTAGISFVVLGVPAALLGSVLPLWIRLISRASATLGRHVGRLLTWNTLGAVTGSLLAGFVVMPTMGLHASLIAVAILLTLVAAAMTLRGGKPAAAIAAAGCGVILLILAFEGRTSWQRVVTSGVFRWREADVAWDAFKKEWQYYEIIFYEDAPDATVAVERPRRQRGEEPELILTINGKPDASTHRDLSTQYLLAHLPMMARPDAKDVFVLGMGSGITAGALLGHPIQNLVVAENCKPVLRAAELFEPWNRGVLTNSRTRIYREDARTVLKLSPKTYDIVISEPSNPWVAGVGSVFTREFYELAASRLNEGGVMSQWFHMYEMEDEIVWLVLRTFHSVFPFFEVWESQFGDLILLGSKTPWESSPEQFSKAFEWAAPLEDMKRIGLNSPEAVWARQLASQETSFALPGNGAVQTDTMPILEFAATRAFYIGRRAEGIFSFDERTLQSHFAPPRKREILQSFDDNLLLPIFAEFRSDNTSLMRYLAWRSQNPSRAGGDRVYRDEPFLPMIFRQTETYPEQAAIPTGADPYHSQLLEAEALIHSRPDRWAEGVQMIRTVRLEHDPSTRPIQTTSWSPADFFAIEAKALYEHGDPEGALETVRHGLELEPGERQLEYLERLLARKIGAAD